MSSSSAWAHAVICDERSRARLLLPQPVPLRLERAPPHARGARRPGLARRRCAASSGAGASGTGSPPSASTATSRTRAPRRRASAPTSAATRASSTRRSTPSASGRGRSGDHYLVLSELVSHKQIDIAVEAFNRLRLPLVVAGDGPDRRRLGGWPGPTITFAGRVSDAEAARLLASCRALVVTAREEFGIAAVEAQAAGRPVIARGAGGLLETVIEGETGCFWDGGPEELAAAVLAFDADAVDPEACIENARRFDSAVFRDAFRARSRARCETGRPSGSRPRCGWGAGRRPACGRCWRGAAARVSRPPPPRSRRSAAAASSEREQRHGRHLPVPVEPGVERPGGQRRRPVRRRRAASRREPDTGGAHAAEEERRAAPARRGPARPRSRGRASVRRARRPAGRAA